MTRPDFLPRFLAALVTLEAEVLTSYPHVYPTGPLIRVKVRPPWVAQRHLPPLVDPIGAVWLAEQGEFRSVLDSSYLGMVRLGMAELDCLACLEAADKPVEKLGEGEARLWRQAMEACVEGYRLSSVYAWR